MGDAGRSVCRWYCFVLRSRFSFTNTISIYSSETCKCFSIKAWTTYGNSFVSNTWLLPPHPGPVVIAKELKANVGEVLLYGMIIAIPVTLIAGPIFNKVAQNDSVCIQKKEIFQR